MERISILKTLPRLISRQWILVTLLVIAAAIVMVRLGIWQLDRLAGRQVFNAQVLAMQNLPPLDMNIGEVPDDLATMEFRAVQVTGEYDYSQQIILGNQGYENELGIHLLTPLKIAGTDQTILVDRGWVPYSDVINNDLEKYNQPGTIRLEGVLRGSQTQTGLKQCIDEYSTTTEHFTVWCVSLEGLAARLPYPLLTAYVWQTPESDQVVAPFRSELQIEISEGPHLGYAIQWFTFAGLLLTGYPFFVRREAEARLKRQNEQVGNLEDSDSSAISGEGQVESISAKHA